MATHFWGGIHFFLSHNMTWRSESDWVSRLDNNRIEVASYLALSLVREGKEESIMKDVLSNTRSETDFALVISRQVRNRHLRPNSCSASEDMLPSSCDPWMCRLLTKCSLLLTALSTSSPVCDGVSNDKRRRTAGSALISPSICAESHRNEGVYLTLFNDGKPFKQPDKRNLFNRLVRLGST